SSARYCAYYRAGNCGRVAPLDSVRGITALEKLHERVGNAISRSHASVGSTMIRGWCSNGMWIYGIWQTMCKMPRWPGSQDGWVRRGEGRRYGHCVDRALE